MAKSNLAMPAKGPPHLHVSEADMARIDRMTSNLISMNIVDFAYSKLARLKVDLTMEFLLEVEALTGGLVTAYGRMFTGAEGATKLKDNIFPPERAATHQMLMDLRHRRYAHHGAHPSISSAIELELDTKGVLLQQSYRVTMCLGAPPEWAPHFKFLREHLSDALEQQLAHLSRKTGLQWRMEGGPPPEWIVDGDARTESN